MSEYAAIKSDFIREAARKCWTTPSPDWPVPDDVQKRWLVRLYSPIELDWTGPRRLVNHFLLGADPEFVFLDSAGQHFHANNFRLKAGVAFGADNNGRLAELRPVPSRFALEVVASIATTLKWLAMQHPDTLPFTWRSGAFYEQDGLGGHIHFGRRRPTSEEEVLALNKLVFLLYHGNIYNPAEGRNRLRNTNYGRLSDKRAQSYGYEYRTFPSWLDSPWLAYFSLVLAKLAVYDPNFYTRLVAADEKVPTADATRFLRALLAYYKPLDDDAALAYSVLSRHGPPRYIQDDFKGRWGIFSGELPFPIRTVQVPPREIPPTNEEIAEMRRALLENCTPDLITLEPTWKPSVLPKDYIPLIIECNTRVSPGIGEIAVRFAYHIRYPMAFGIINDRDGDIWISKNMKEVLGPFLSVIASNYNVRWSSGSSGDQILLGRRLREDATVRDKFIQFLARSKALPLWLLEDVTEKSVMEWEAARAQAQKDVSVQETRKSSISCIYPTETAVGSEED